MSNLESTNEEKNSQCKVTVYESSVRNSTWEFLEHSPLSEQQITTTSKTSSECCSACLHESCYDLRDYLKS